MYILTSEPKGETLAVAFRVLDDAFGTEEFDYEAQLARSTTPKSQTLKTRLID